jgi:hypothetical protein
MPACAAAPPPVDRRWFLLPAVPSGRYGPAMHVVRGLRQALVMVLGAAVLGLVGAGLWTAWQGGEFRRALALALVILAGVLALTGGTALSRGGTNDINAFFGRGPEREEPITGDSLTSVGVFLFVSVPLFVLGGLLYGTG